MKTKTKLTKEEIHNYLMLSYQAPVVHVANECFGGEFFMICEDGTDYSIMYNFADCYRTEVWHDFAYKDLKYYRRRDLCELPFYLEDWDIEISDDVYIIKMVAGPLSMEIWCKEIGLERIKRKRGSIVS